MNVSFENKTILTSNLSQSQDIEVQTEVAGMYQVCIKLLQLDPRIPKSQATLNKKLNENQTQTKENLTKEAGAKKFRNRQKFQKKEDKNLKVDLNILSSAQYKLLMLRDKKKDITYRLELWNQKLQAIDSLQISTNSNRSSVEQQVQSLINIKRRLDIFSILVIVCASLLSAQKIKNYLKQIKI